MVLEIDGAGTYSLITRRTIENDIALSNLLRSSGAERALIDALTEGEEPDSKVFAAVSGSGKLFDILGAALVPEGTDPLEWTPKLQQQTADTLKRVISDAGKRTILLCIVPLVTSFFLAGLHSTATSRSFTDTPASQVQPDSENAATTTSATGPSWFASWLDTIRAALGRSFAGRSAKP
jgi:hypothetical protein